MVVTSFDNFFFMLNLCFETLVNSQCRDQSLHRDIISTLALWEQETNR